MQGSLVLIDTSVWIEAFRRDGDTDVRSSVEALIHDSRAAWCDIILTELWNGAKGAHEIKVIMEYEKVIPRLIVDKSTWHLSHLLARECRAKGYTVPAVDILVASCAFRYKVDLFAKDKHFIFLEKLRSRSEKFI